jgi:hypothetical protein
MGWASKLALLTWSDLFSVIRAYLMTGNMEIKLENREVRGTRRTLAMPTVKLELIRKQRQ